MRYPIAVLYDEYGYPVNVRYVDVKQEGIEVVEASVYKLGDLLHPLALPLGGTSHRLYCFYLNHSDFRIAKVKSDGTVINANTVLVLYFKQKIYAIFYDGTIKAITSLQALRSKGYTVITENSLLVYKESGTFDVKEAQNRAILLPEYQMQVGKTEGDLIQHQKRYQLLKGNTGILRGKLMVYAEETLGNTPCLISEIAQYANIKTGDFAVKTPSLVFPRVLNTLFVGLNNAVPNKIHIGVLQLPEVVATMAISCEFIEQLNSPKIIKSNLMQYTSEGTQLALTIATLGDKTQTLFKGTKAEERLRDVGIVIPQSNLSYVHLPYAKNVTSVIQTQLSELTIEYAAGHSYYREAKQDVVLEDIVCRWLKVKQTSNANLIINMPITTLDFYNTNQTNIQCENMHINIRAPIERICVNSLIKRLYLYEHSRRGEERVGYLYSLDIGSEGQVIRDALSSERYKQYKVKLEQWLEGNTEAYADVQKLSSFFMRADLPVYNITVAFANLFLQKEKPKNTAWGEQVYYFTKNTPTIKIEPRDTVVLFQTEFNEFLGDEISYCLSLFMPMLVFANKQLYNKMLKYLDYMIETVELLGLKLVYATIRERYVRYVKSK